MNALPKSIAGLVAVLTIGLNQAIAQLPSVVQLPTFHTFSYSGSVLVPDGGTTSLGGIRSSAMSSQRSLGNRSFGVSHANAHAAVSATIIDLNERDRQILGVSPETLAGSGRAQASRKKMDPVEEGKSLVRYARQQYREGKQTESFVTYQMAIGILDGKLRELAQAEFRRVFGQAADQSLGMAQRLR